MNLKEFSKIPFLQLKKIDFIILLMLMTPYILTTLSLYTTLVLITIQYKCFVLDYYKIV